MRTPSASERSALLEKIANQRSEKQSSRSEQRQSRAEARSERNDSSERSSRGRRSRRGRNSESETEAVEANPGTPTSTPGENTTPTQATTTTPATSSAKPTVDELAGLYVKQYEEQSGVQLTDEAFAQKKAEVANFYSKLSNGSDRLDTVVFSNDSVKA